MKGSPKAAAPKEAAAAAAALVAKQKEQLTAQTRLKVKGLLAQPGVAKEVEQMLRGNQMLDVPPELELDRTESFVICGPDLFEAVVNQGQKQAYLNLREGEEVMGGSAKVGRNGIYAEVRIGKPVSAKPPKPDEQGLDKALEVLSQPKPTDEPRKARAERAMQEDAELLDGSPKCRQSMPTPEFPEAE